MVREPVHWTRAEDLAHRAFKCSASSRLLATLCGTGLVSGVRCARWAPVKIMGKWSKMLWSAYACASPAGDKYVTVRTCRPPGRRKRVRVGST